MFNILDIGDETAEPKIRKYPEGEYGDSPNLHRWRAWWDRSAFGHGVIGIELRCYPVTKLTPCGAWIDPHAWTRGGRNGIEWETNHSTARWVSNDGGAAWAKRTQAEALISLAVRYQRWSQRIVSDATYFIHASKALKILMPDRAHIADERLREFAHSVTTEIAGAQT